MTHLRRVREILIPTGIAAATLLVGCDMITGSGDGAQFNHEITVSDFQEAVASGPTRVEVELEFGSFIAREVQVEEPEALTHEEQIESLVIDVQTSGDQGTLTLFLGRLQVGFGADTRFSAGEAGEMSYGDFVAEVQASLGSGHEPRIEVRRDPPAEPQDPTDATFYATYIKLRDAVAPKIEMNVDGDNLEVNDDPAPGEADAWINVLGLRLELLVSEGITDLGEEDEHYSDEVEFEGHVASVDLEASSFTLGDGTVIRIVDDTKIREGEDGHTLSSLEAVIEALEAEKDVVAWGAGVIEGEEPLTLLAIEVAFVIAHDGGDDESGHFEGVVMSVDLEGGSVTLVNGTVVRIVDDTHFADGEGKLTSLAAVYEAWLADQEIIAYGHGNVESVEPLTIAAIEVAFVEVTSP